MEKLLEILNKINPEADFANESRWIENGLIDSMGILMLITDIKKEFGVEFTEDMLVMESFESLDVFWNVIKKQLEKQV